jgi:hypothetical protein
MKRYTVSSGSAGKGDQSAEIRRLKQELARVTEERDILKETTNDIQLYQSASGKVQCPVDVPNVARPSKWLLYVAEAAIQQTRC